MSVLVHRELRCVVSEPFGDHFGGHAGPQRQRRVGVAQIMEPNPRDPGVANRTTELCSNAVRMQGSAAFVAEYKAVLSAESCQSATVGVRAQHGARCMIEVDDTGVVRFRCRFDDAVGD